MLFMVTNRRIMNGAYGDEERPNKKYEYQYAYNKKARGQDKFEKTGKTGHGREWKDLAKEVGCKPKRCADLADINLPTPKYIGICSSCGNKTNFYRKVNKTYSCSKCSKKFDPRYVLKIVPA